MTLTAIECPVCEEAQRDLEAALRARDQAIRGRDAAVAHLESAEVELRAKRSIITKLKGEIEELQAAASPADVNDVAEAVFAYWRARLHPNAKSFKGKRRAHVLERLSDKPKPYSCLDLLNAVDGAVVSAWTGPNGVRHDDLEFICRDPSITDRFIQAAMVHEQWIASAMTGIVGDWCSDLLSAAAA